MKQMMALAGREWSFVFSLSGKTPYEGLSRTSDGGWVTVPRFGAKPLSQFTGQALDTIQLSGEWYRGEGMANLQQLRDAQARAEPLLLSDGYGTSLGRWVIKQLQEQHQNIIDDGTAMVVRFTIGLEEYIDAGS